MTDCVLLTSAGGLTGTYLAKRLRRAGGRRVVCVDMAETTTAGLFADALYAVPPVTSPEYLSVLADICRTERVAKLIPVTSYDVNLFSGPEARAALRGVKWLTMGREDHLRLHDKRAAGAYLQALGISAPRALDAPVYPCVFKPALGSGTKNTFVLENEADYAYWAKKVPEHVLVEWLPGKEYTVDCLFDGNGRCLGANPRERVKMNGGGAVVTRNAYGEDVSPIVRALERAGVVKGPVNFQYKRRATGEVCVFDFNTRLASGGLPLTVESGFDIPELLLRLLDGEHPPVWSPDPKNDGLTMLRYYDEGFVGADGAYRF